MLRALEPEGQGTARLYALVHSVLCLLSAEGFFVSLQENRKDCFQLRQDLCHIARVVRSVPRP